MVLVEEKSMVIPETKEILRHYSFIMSTEKTKGVRSNFQKQYTLTQLNLQHDPYLSRIDISRFLSTEPLFSDIRYQELVYILDNYADIVELAGDDKIFKPRNKEKVGKKLVFVLWFQGEHQAPPLVQMNIKRMRKYMSEFEVVVLNDENLSEWIDTDCIPNFNYLRENFPANCSDLIRVYLLAIYGGLWLDSTVVITEKSVSFFEKVMNKNSHFLLRYGPFRIASWLMASSQNDLSMKIQFSALSLWLNEHQSFIEYFQFHTFFEIFSMLNQSFIDTDYLKASEAFLLSKHWSEVYSVSKIKSIFDTMPFQKLNYKIDRSRVLPRTVEYLYENYLNPLDDSSLRNMLSLPFGKDNYSELFYVSDVRTIIAKKDLDIFSSVDFRDEERVGKVFKGERYLVEYISGTIAGTPRLKIPQGYVSANKNYVKKLN